jgi:hypothetical protein
VILAWGARVDAAFRARVLHMAARLPADPSHLMAVMYFESRLNPAAVNATSGATGLIQFMPATARDLGTTVEALRAMTAVEQLDYVERYFARYAGRLSTLNDVYMAVLWPLAIGKPDDYILFASPQPAYTQNRALDVNNDGAVTKAEACSFVARRLAEGLQPGNAYDDGAPARTATPQPAGPTGTQPHQREDQRMAPLAILGTLLPTVLQMFSGKAQSAIQRATGADPEAAQQLTQQLFQSVGQAVGVPVIDDKSAIQAVGKLTAAPQSTIQKVEDDTLQFLDRMAPLLEKIAALGREDRKASDDSFDRAAARADNPNGWALRMSQVRFTQWGLGVAAIVVGVLTGAQMYLSSNDTPDPALMVLLTAIVMGLVNTFRDQTGFSFGGTVDSNAAAMVQRELDARRQPTGGK